mmetsp:Transcript_3050/g.8854  ORF Transcript_3050/g.8854 Transcript_3050/m.8854 type:complete len:369 (-) Transcript_3050:988-2094(-)
MAAQATARGARGRRCATSRSPGTTVRRRGRSGGRSWSANCASSWGSRRPPRVRRPPRPRRRRGLAPATPAAAPLGLRSRNRTARCTPRLRRSSPRPKAARRRPVRFRSRSVGGPRCCRCGRIGSAAPARSGRATLATHHRQAHRGCPPTAPPAIQVATTGRAAAGGLAAAEKRTWRWRSRRSSLPYPTPSGASPKKARTASKCAAPEAALTSTLLRVPRAMSARAPVPARYVEPPAAAPRCMALRARRRAATWAQMARRPRLPFRQRRCPSWWRTPSSPSGRGSWKRALAECARMRSESGRTTADRACSTGHRPPCLRVTTSVSLTTGMVASARPSPKAARPRPPSRGRERGRTQHGTIGASRTCGER